MTAAFNNHRAGTFAHMIWSKSRMATEMINTLRMQIEAGVGKRTGARLEAWREAFDYCAASGQSVYLSQIERHIMDAETAAA